MKQHWNIDKRPIELFCEKTLKRKKREYDLEPDPFSCYKMYATYNASRNEFESTTKWLYLGANVRDSNFAKVGLTMGDLSSRSSSSESPSYYIFCAFKCIDSISRKTLKGIETQALNYLQAAFTYPDGSTKRILHSESEEISECFHDINFIDFLCELHYYLYCNHRNNFVLSTFVDEHGYEEGDFIDCEFNSRCISHQEIKNHIKMILQ